MDPITIEGAKLSAKALWTLIVSTVGIAALIGLWLFLSGPQRARVEAAQARATATTAASGQKAAHDALEITGKVQDAHVRIDLVTKGNADAIRNAPGASAAVDPALHAAGLGALRMRDAYRVQPAAE